MTAQQLQGVLPNFLIAGMMKSGTSALASYLGQHPDVWMPQRELHFFNRNRLYAGGADAYRTHFHGWAGQSAVGEKTPIYGFHPQAAERIAQMLPDVKLIWILREPTARAYSHYWFSTSQGWEPYSFQAALAAEPRRLALPQPNFSLANRAYRTLGYYAQQLKSFCERMPPHRHLFLLYSDFVAAPEATLVRICNFLEIDPTYPFDTFDHSVNVTYRPYSAQLQWLVTRGMAHLFRTPRFNFRVLKMMQRINLRRAPGYPPLEESLRRDLDAHYAPRNTLLAELTGLTLADWPLA